MYIYNDGNKLGTMKVPGVELSIIYNIDFKFIREVRVCYAKDVEQARDDKY